MVSRSKLECYFIYEEKPDYVVWLVTRLLQMSVKELGTWYGPWHVNGKMRYMVWIKTCQWNDGLWHFSRRIRYMKWAMVCQGNDDVYSKGHDMSVDGLGMWYGLWHERSVEGLGTWHAMAWDVSAWHIGGIIRCVIWAMAIVEGLDTDNSHGIIVELLG